jgi:hypothetical protein
VAKAHLVRGMTSSAGLVLVLVAMVSAHGQSAPPATPMSLAVTGIDYTDSSGEQRDQGAAHQARVQALGQALLEDLGKSGKFHPIELTCPQGPCSAATDADELITRAKAAGASAVLYGGIHKMSSLVEYAKFQVVDIRDNKVVFDRLMTFRGDSDEAWQHLERFLVRELSQVDFAQP